MKQKKYKKKLIKKVCFKTLMYLLIPCLNDHFVMTTHYTHLQCGLYLNIYLKAHSLKKKPQTYLLGQLFQFFCNFLGCKKKSNQIAFVSQIKPCVALFNFMLVIHATQAFICVSFVKFEIGTWFF